MKYVLFVCNHDAASRRWLRRSSSATRQRTSARSRPGLIRQYDVCAGGRRGDGRGRHRSRGPRPRKLLPEMQVHADCGVRRWMQRRLPVCPDHGRVSRSSTDRRAASRGRGPHRSATAIEAQVRKLCGRGWSRSTRTRPRARRRLARCSAADQEFGGHAPPQEMPGVRRTRSCARYDDAPVRSFASISRHRARRRAGICDPPSDPSLPPLSGSRDPTGSLPRRRVVADARTTGVPCPSTCSRSCSPVPTPRRRRRRDHRHPRQPPRAGGRARADRRARHRARSTAAAISWATGRTPTRSAR